MDRSWEPGAALLAVSELLHGLVGDHHGEHSRQRLDDVGIVTCAWVSCFNEERLHSELDDRTPAEVEAESSLRKTHASSSFAGWQSQACFESNLGLSPSRLT
jgi:hypothetical protein